MKSHLAAPLVVVLAAIATPAFADKAPPIKESAANKVPACTTPGRLQAQLQARNPALDSRYKSIAAEYMRHGEALGLRWDYAFYQMLVETGSLSYRNGTKPGDVKPSQNNFAGLGATGKGEPGESFKDISSGVRAHLQHLAMYAGDRIAEPVAERTRKVQEWGVLTSWHQRFKRPITFADMGQKWAPGSRSYWSMIESVAEQFEDDFCGKPDPHPELVAAARAGREVKVAKAATPGRDEIGEKISGAELARRAVEEARAEGNATRSGLGVGAARKDAVMQPTTILNAPKGEPRPEAPVQQASAAAGAVAGARQAPSSGPPAAAAPASDAKCRVFQASYGGQKSVIIRAAADDGTNFTVLDVNEGQEKRETDAFIQAYAKGGQMVGEFTSQALALDKAFELCPEG